MQIIINEEKFIQFYDNHVTKIYRYIYFRIGSEETAQDLSSEAFLKTWQYIKDGNEIGNLSAMIYKICRNLIADYFRKTDTLPIPIESVAERSFAETEKGIIKKSDDNMVLDLIKDRLRILRDDYQDIIIWHYIDDFEVSEIAQIMGKSEGSVRTMLSRALKALKDTIKANN